MGLGLGMKIEGWDMPEDNGAPAKPIPEDDIGHAIQNLAEKHNYGVVRDFVGHGVGQKMHEEPQVPNFGTQGTGPRIKEGMVIAIEPMFNLGTFKVKVLQDGWTVVTRDEKSSAHFEHTIALTEDGPKVLTQE